jgi:hypothetical protein
MAKGQDKGNKDKAKNKEKKKLTIKEKKKLKQVKKDKAAGIFKPSVASTLVKEKPAVKDK